MTLSSFYPAEREILTFAYIRLSNDNTGTMQSPETQWNGIVSVAHRFDVPVPPPERVFTDRNLSATDPNVVRLDYQRLLSAIRAVDPMRYEVVVLSFLQDRAYRQPAEWQAFVELVGPEGYDGRHLDETGNVDLSYNGVYAVGAAYGESKKTRLRTRANIATTATKGGGHGVTPYGWTREYDHSGTGKPVSTTVIVEAQAAVVRDAANRVLKGEHLGAICRDLNAQGIPAPGAGTVRKRDKDRNAIAWAGSEWTIKALRKILLRPANIGIRAATTTRGKRRVATGEYKANWSAILDDDVYRRVCAILNDPSRRTTMSSTAKYLGTGIYKCGVCGTLLTGQLTSSIPKARGGGRREAPGYRCPKGHVFRTLQLTDELVITEVLHMLSQSEVRASLTTPPDAEATAALGREAALLARRNEVEGGYASGQFDLGTLARVTADIDSQLVTVRAVVNRTQDVEIYSDLLRADPADLEAMWEALPLDRQRSIIRALFDVVILRTTSRGLKTFDPGTVIVNLRPMKG